MTKYQKFIYLISSILIFQTTLIFTLTPDLKLDRNSTKTKQPEQKKNEHTSEGQKPVNEIQLSSNWVARGGCWDFSKKVIRGQGIGSRPIAYFKTKNYKDFKFEIKLRILTDDDGSYGMVFRFDEKKDSGYIFGIYPHDDYEFSRLEDELAHHLAGGPAVYMTDQLKTWNTISVICKGTKIELYVNGNPLVTVNDDTYKSGRVGFYLGGGPRSILEYEVQSLVIQ